MRLRSCPPTPKSGFFPTGKGSDRQRLSWPPLPPSLLVTSQELWACRAWSSLSTELLSAFRPKKASSPYILLGLLNPARPLQEAPGLTSARFWLSKLQKPGLGHLGLSP